MSNTETTVVHSNDVTIEVKQAKKRTSMHVTVGNGLVNKEGDKSIDVIYSMLYMSFPERWLINKLIHNVDRHKGVNYTNTATLKLSSLLSNEVLYVKKAYTKLFKKGYIIRTSKEHYLINPDYLVPKYGYYDAVRKVWDGIK